MTLQKCGHEDHWRSAGLGAWMLMYYALMSVFLNSSKLLGFIGWPFSNSTWLMIELKNAFINLLLSRYWWAFVVPRYEAQPVEMNNGWGPWVGLKGGVLCSFQQWSLFVKAYRHLVCYCWLH